MAEGFYFGETDDIEFTPDGESAIDLTPSSTTLEVTEAVESVSLATRSNHQRSRTRNNGGTAVMNWLEDSEESIWDNTNLKRNTEGVLKVYENGNASGHKWFSYPVVIAERSRNSEVNAAVAGTINFNITGDESTGTVS